MKTVKLLTDDMLMKEGDTKTFTVQLLDEGCPYQIQPEAFVRLLIANEHDVLVSKLITIDSKGSGIVTFTIDEELGDGLFDCELVVSDGEDLHVTFPEKDYQALRIVPNLENRPSSSIPPNSYQLIITRLNNLESELESHTHVYDDLVDKPFIPESVSDLVNDRDYVTKTEMNIALEPKANIEDVHLKSELEVGTYTEEEVLAIFTAMFG